MSPERSPTGQLQNCTPLNRRPMCAGMRFRNTANANEVGDTVRVLNTSAPIDFTGHRVLTFN